MTASVARPAAARLCSLWLRARAGGCASGLGRLRRSSPKQKQRSLVTQARTRRPTRRSRKRTQKPDASSSLGPRTGTHPIRTARTRHIASSALHATNLCVSARPPAGDSLKKASLHLSITPRQWSRRVPGSTACSRCRRSGMRLAAYVVVCFVARVTASTSACPASQAHRRELSGLNFGCAGSLDVGGTIGTTHVLYAGGSLSPSFARRHCP